MKLFARACLRLLVLLVLGGALQEGAYAQSAAQSFFHGKTVKILVGYSPGGGYDVYAHMIAPYLAKELGSTVIVDNEPGAGGLRALDNLYAMEPDGLTIMLVKGNAALMAQLTDQPGVRYDLAKFTYLGGTGASPEVWLSSPSAPIKTASDAIKANTIIRWAATGPMDGASDVAAMICEALKLRCKVILGYPGTNDMALALGRDETDAAVTSDASGNAYVQEKSAWPIATLSHVRSAYFPDLPTIYEATSLSPAAKWWFDLRSTTAVLGRIFVAPPGLPAQRLAFLQDAVRKALTDPELITQGKKSRYFVQYQQPDDTRAAALKILLHTSSQEKQRIKEVTAMK